MKEFKGTKGIWEVRDYDLKLETVIVCGNFRIAEAKHYNTGVKDRFVNDPTLKEGRANAKLIAAAPDLLRELIFLVENIEGLGNTGEEMEKLKTKLSDAKNAINKAI